MTRFLSVGYDIREAFANDPARPQRGYSLPPGNVTMDSSLCRPWTPPTKSRAIPFRRWDEAVQAYQTIPAGIRLRYAVYRFQLEAGAFDILAHRIVPEHADETPGVRLDRCGFDVVSYDDLLSRWRSHVANEGLVQEVLRRHGPLTPFSLFESLEAAVSFRDSLDAPDESAEESLVAIVERAPSTGNPHR